MCKFGDSETLFLALIMRYVSEKLTSNLKMANLYSGRGCRLPSAYLHSILYLRLPMGTRVPDCWYISSDWAKLIPLSPFTVVDLWAAIPGGTAQYFLLDRHRRPYTSRWCGQIVRLFFVSSSQNIPIVYKVSCYLLFWWRKHRCSYIRSI